MKFFRGVMIGMPVSGLLWALLIVGSCALASRAKADTSVVITDAERQQLFANDGPFDACLQKGGQRCVLIQDWLKSKLQQADQKAAEDRAKVVQEPGK